MSFRLSLFVALVVAVANFFTPATGRAGVSIQPAAPPRTEEVPSVPQFELSLGYNYIYQGDDAPETKNLHGGDLSAFWNVTSWLGLGGDFMANVGERSERAYFSDFNIESRRFFYVFGPRMTVWRGDDFRVFVEALAGGVHAEADTHVGRFHQNVTADDFAMAIGAGVDCRLTRHFSWRIIQADYLPTNLGNNWQDNFRASTGFVLTFGER